MKPSVKIALIWIAYIAVLVVVVLAAVTGLVCLVTGRASLGIALWLVVGCAVALAFGLVARGR